MIWQVTRRARPDLLLLACCLIAGPVVGQTAEDPLDAIGAADTICATASESLACAAARLRSGALMALMIAEAGNTRDRGAFIDLVRAVLADPSPEIRTSALYALAKLQPDASDTPTILALLRDPVSNVRAGAWAAARRVPKRPDRTGYAPADPGRDFNVEALGFTVPEGVEYLRLTSELRNLFQLEFLTLAPQANVLVWAATLGADRPVPLTDLLESDPATAALALGFLHAKAFGDPQVVRVPPDGDHPLRLIVVYRDLLFGQTGITIIFGDQGALPTPEPVAEVILPDPQMPPDSAVFYEASLRASGFNRKAPEAESDLFLSIRSAYGLAPRTTWSFIPTAPMPPKPVRS